MVAAWNIQCFSSGYGVGQLFRGTRDRVFGADRDKNRTPERCDLMAWNAVAGRHDAGGKRPAVAFRLIGEKALRTRSGCASPRKAAMRAPME